MLDTAVTQTRMDTSFQLTSQDAAGTQKYTDAVAADIAAFDTAMAAYRASGPSGDPAVIADLEAQWQAYVQVVQTKMLPAGKRNDIAAWETARNTEVLPLVGKINKDIAALTAAEDAAAAASAAAAQVGLRVQPRSSRSCCWWWGCCSRSGSARMSPGRSCGR